jgi:hypothetical protein
MSSSEVAFNEQNNREWEGGTGEVKLPVVAVENEADELHTERAEEEQVELDKALKDLVLCVALLHPPISTDEFVHFPAEVLVDLPPKADERAFSDTDDDRYNSRERIDRKP